MHRYSRPPSRTAGSGPSAAPTGFAPRLRGSPRTSLPKHRVCHRELRDQPLSCSRVCSLSDRLSPGGEELLLLELHPLPRRVAHHDIEPPLPAQDVIVRELLRRQGLEHVQERQVPVEELVTVRQSGYLILDLARHNVRVVFELSQG